jgi:(p)ppGpp synthase/HD superfamily hydrolase
VLYSSFVERAMRFAAAAHLAHRRKGTDIPYLTHLASVALILTRAGLDDDELLAAALLHDAVEDADVSHEAIAEEFSPRVADLVAAVTEVKRDEEGAALPWRQRKEEHLSRLRHAPFEAKAVALADKLHNLGTLADDLAGDPGAWNRFNAPPAEQFWYHAAVIEAAGDDPRLARLATECRETLERLRGLSARPE